MEKPKLNFAHVCDYAFNGEGGKLGMIGVFKNINVASGDTDAKNIIHPQMFIVTNWQIEKGEGYTQTIKLLSEAGGEPIVKLEFPVSPVASSDDDAIEVNFIGQLSNVVFPKVGKYFFSISIRDSAGKTETEEIDLFVKRV